MRREIILLLADGRLPVGAISRQFSISRPAVSRHLRVLRECGLVSDELVGRHRLCRLHVEPLHELGAWIAAAAAPASAQRWGQRLDALSTEVHRTRREHAEIAATTRPPIRTEDSA